MRKHCLSFSLLLALIFVFQNSHAQVAVSGTVTDSLGKPLQSVSITLKKTNGIVLAFGISNSTGAYKLQWANGSLKDTLLLEANAISYQKQIQPVTAATQVTNFKLSESASKLPNVVVKDNRPLRKEGDTLNYDVKSFSNAQDRTIGDVIKKLPGVEVADNGQISFDGKPINRFYIDGDNLLDGKYNIATKGIPNDAVSKVQVLQNHQPINALKDISKSDQAAMNIVLNEKARLRIMGTGDASVGSPGVYGLSANLMLFQKKVKFINYIKMNNMGIDNSDETFNHFGGGDVTAPGLLSAGIGNPDILKKRYLFNNVGLVTGNDMVNLKNEYQLRINAFYLWDRQFQNYQYSSATYLPTDTIRYMEKQDARTTMNTFNTQFTLTANKKDYYLNNVTTIENTPTNLLAGLQATTSNNITQTLSGSVTSLSNRFNIIRKFTNGKVLEASSYIARVSNPATLQVEPGLYPAQFNNNNPFAALIQHAAVPTFSTDNYISFGRATAKFQQRYKIGVNYQDQQVNSLLESQQLNGNRNAVADSFVNKLNWDRMKAYVQPDFTYSSGSTLLSFSLPLTFQDTKYTGRLTQNHTSNLLFTPRVSLKYMTGREAYISAGYTYGDVYGGVSQVYDGYVMRSYRNFFTNGSLLNESKSHSVNAAYIFKNTLKIFFFQVGGMYLKSESNTINDAQLSSVLQQSRLVPFVNISEMQQLYGSISKYVFPITTTIGGGVSWQRSNGNVLQNGNLIQTQSDMYRYSANINSKLTSWFNIGYTGSYTTSSSKMIDSKSPRPASPQVGRWQHELVANFSISPRFYFRLSGDNYRYMVPGSQDNNYTFADAAFTYKLNKLKTDIELSMTNLANIDTYGSVNLAGNSISESLYRIRPRMAAVKFYFRF